MKFVRYQLPLLFLIACGNDELRSTGKLFNDAETLWRHGSNRRALELADRGWVRWKNRPDSAWHWKFRLLEAELLISEGSRARARELLESSHNKPPTGTIEAWFFSVLAQAKRDQSLADRAYELASQNGDIALQIAIELARADIDGYSTSSDEFLSNAVRLGRAQPDKYFTARALLNSGYQRMSLSRFDEAVLLLEQAEDIAKQAGADRIRGRALGNLGWCYFRLGDFDRALAALSEAVTLARKVEDDVFLYRWLNNIGGVYYKRHEYKQAISSYQTAAELARLAKDETWLTMTLNNLAATSIEIGDLNAAERFIEQAAALIRKNNNTSSLLFLRLHTALIQASRRQPELAETSFRAVIDSVTREKKPSTLWEAQAGLARLLQSVHRDEDADREYRNALATIEGQWSKLGEDRYKVTFLAQLIRFYHDYVDFLTSKGETARAAGVADSSRARVLSQRLGADTSFVAAQPRKDGPILLSYWLTAARSYLWVIAPKGVSQFNLPSEARITELVNQYTASIERGHDPLEGENPAGLELYRELVATASIPHGASVIVVPDGALHRLNFETLIVRDPVPHYWIEDVTIAVAPALGLLQTPPRRSATPTRMLFIGDPAPADPAFPPLPHLGKEAEIVRRRFSSASLLTREQAHPKAYQSANPGDYALIHFATHAVANSESPLDSAVILSKMGDEYKLYARDVMKQRLQADLVTISACRAAGARSYAGEGLLGFTWAFLSAGARNVIAGLWEADDAATAELMDLFYDRLASGSKPAAALRSAKLQLLKSGGRNRTPYYWGPLALFTRDSELGSSDRRLTTRSYSPERNLIDARFQAGRGK
jgi:CHAT domain-containing protein/Tfp pilus assembly protein PilF